MARTLDELVVRVAADTSKMRQELRAGLRELQNFKGQSAGTLAGIDKAFAGVRAFAGALGIGVSVAALANFGRRAIEAAGGVAELADQLGISTDALQVYQFGASQAGVKTQELDSALSHLTARLGEAAQDGSGPASLAFRRLGVDLREVLESANPTEAALRAIAEAAKRSGADARFAADAKDVLGRSGQRLIPLLKAGAAGFERLRVEAQAAGAVLDRDALDAADKASDALARMEVSAGKLGQTLMTKVAPWLERVANGWNALLSGQERRLGLSEQIVELNRQLIDAHDRLENLRATGLEGLMEPAAAHIADLERRLDELIQRARAEAERAPPPLEIKVGRAPETAEHIKALDDIRKGWVDMAEASVKASDEEAASLAKLESARLDEHAKALDDIRDGWVAVAEASVKASDEEAASLARIQIERLKDAMDAAKEASRDMAHAIGTAFEDAVIAGQGLRGVLHGLAQDMQRIALRATVTKPLENLLAGALQGGLGGLFGGGGGSPAFGGGRAHGGPVDRRVPYLIGEEGPELFTPDVPGTIVPNHRLRELLDAGGGPEPGTGPGLGGPYGAGFPDLASYMDAVATDRTGMARAFSFAAGVFGAPAASPDLAQALGFGQPGLWSGPGPGESDFSVDQSWGPDREGQAGGPGAPGGQGGPGSQNDPVGSDPTGGSASFARGGRPPVGLPSLVGERGPEVFVPRLPARAAADDGRGGGAVFNLNYTINAPGADAGVVPLIRAAMRESEARTLAQVRSLADRGGSFARSVGRR